jgi:carboxyl-terminal processing protease
MRLTIARYYTPTGRLIQKPYNDGYEDYAMDLINRYNSGELNTSDSIIFSKTNKYETLIKKRTVYGGGGIMPDYFVPFDTTSFSPYYRNLISQGVFNQFVLKYIDKNRPSLERKYKNFESFKNEYDPSLEMDNLISFAEQEGLSFNEQEWQRSGKRIELLFKAYIARDLWEMGMFYQIYNEYDPIFLKAKDILKDPKYYTDKL